MTWTVVENSTFLGHPVSRVETGTVSVENMENITVPAGTFTCFRVVAYGEYDEIIGTVWYSDEVKYWVKIGEMELLSYLVQ